MTRAELDAAYAAAFERKQARRNVYNPYTEQERRQAWLEDRELPPRLGLYAPEFAEPKTAAEFWDDRVIAHGSPLGFGGLPESLVLVAVAVAAQESAMAAVYALGAGKRLEPPVQWVVFQNLQNWRGTDDADRLGMRGTVDGLIAEWSRLRLQETDPEAERQPKRRRPPWAATEARVVLG